MHVRDACERLLDLGVTEIDLGETLGVAQPDDIRRVLGALGERLAPSTITLHLHDTNGQGVANAMAALEMGVRSFDSSAGGLGGCPFAPGARGNVATDAWYLCDCRCSARAGFGAARTGAGAASRWRDDCAASSKKRDHNSARRDAARDSTAMRGGNVPAICQR